MSNDPPPPPSPPEPPPVPVSSAPPEPPPVPSASPPPPPPHSSNSSFESDLGSERNLAMFCHLAAIAGMLAGWITAIPIPFGNILGPLIVWLIKKDTMPLVNSHGKESLNFQITVSLAIVTCLVLFFLVLPLLLIPVIWVASLVLTIIATVKASRGQFYRYPFTLRLIK